MNKELSPKQFIVTVLADEDSQQLSTFQVAEALENYITRTKGLRAGVDCFVKVVNNDWQRPIYQL